MKRIAVLAVIAVAMVTTTLTNAGTLPDSDFRYAEFKTDDKATKPIHVRIEEWLNVANGPDKLQDITAFATQKEKGAHVTVHVMQLKGSGSLKVAVTSETINYGSDFAQQIRDAVRQRYPAVILGFNNGLDAYSIWIASESP